MRRAVASLLDRRQHPMAAEADTFDSIDEALARPRGLPEGGVGRCRLLRRGVAGEGRSGRRSVPVTDLYDVPLMVAAATPASRSCTAAEYIHELDVPTEIFHFGDHDPRA